MGEAHMIDVSDVSSPHDDDAEKSLLGSVLIRPLAFADLAFTVAPDDFFMPANRVIWSAMAEVQRRGFTIEPNAVTDELKARGELRRLEEGYLMDLASCVPTAELAAQYASIVVEKATSRRLIALCVETMSRSRGGVCSPELIEVLTRESAKLVVHGPGVSWRWAGCRGPPHESRAGVEREVVSTGVGLRPEEHAYLDALASRLGTYGFTHTSFGVDEDALGKPFLFVAGRRDGEPMEATRPLVGGPGLALQSLSAMIDEVGT
jgi:hypothetical protein